jgi:hypothetical protein
MGVSWALLAIARNLREIQPLRRNESCSLIIVSDSGRSARNPNSQPRMQARRFGIRISDFLWFSAFGFRI